MNNETNWDAEEAKEQSPIAADQPDTVSNHDWRKEQQKRDKKELKLQCIAMAIQHFNNPTVTANTTDDIVKSAQAFYDFTRK